MALSEIQIKKAKAAERPYKLADGEGLFLLVQKNGSKLWRLRSLKDRTVHLPSLQYLTIPIVSRSRGSENSRT